jgi:hypothetical protein
VKKIYFVFKKEHSTKGDGWAKLIARLLVPAVFLWVRIQTSPKNTKMGDISKAKE